MNFFTALFKTPAKMLAKAIQKAPYPISHVQEIVPFTPKSNTGTLICRQAYCTNYDEDAKIPIWVAYTLKPEYLKAPLKRKDSFQTDFSLPSGKRSELVDYRNSNYDTGHMANDADMSWDQQVQKESFILTNMAPQTAALNRGSWKALENHTRKTVETYNKELVIFCGNIWTSNSETIGPNKVVVPDQCWKVIYSPSANVYNAYIFDNNTHHMALELIQGTELQKFRIELSKLEALTDLQFEMVQSPGFEPGTP